MTFSVDQETIQRMTYLRDAVHAVGLRRGTATREEIIHELAPKLFGLYTSTDYAKAIRELVRDGLIARPTAKASNRASRCSSSSPRRARCSAEVQPCPRGAQPQRHGGRTPTDGDRSRHRTVTRSGAATRSAGALLNRPSLPAQGAADAAAPAQQLHRAGAVPAEFLIVGGDGDTRTQIPGGNALAE